ncbi:MAG TPA: lipopolysaccharide heptosyltransferase I [Rhodocyclaceae bacterium]|nr:lipopolysaccharide heptosyltransferase I [Rhodocyclaceae bacterium]
MRSVLLVKTSSLGDVIHNLPVVSDLHRMWPNMAIDWVVEESFADIPRMHSAVRKIIPVAIRRWRHDIRNRATRQEIKVCIRELRANYYDMVIDTQGLIKSALITRLAQGLRCGYARESAREPLAAWAYDCQFAIPRNAHAVERNRWLSAAAGEYSLELPLHYGLSIGDDAPSWLPQKPYVVMLSATSRPDKLWPEENWIALGQALFVKGLVCVLPTGNDTERERAERIALEIPNAIVAPPSSLNELAIVMRDARCVVGVDTGLTHLAAALNRPVAAIYVATDPGLTGVYAGNNAKNIGGAGQVPTPNDVFTALSPYLT